MGWTNSHLHAFTINDEVYSPSEFLNDDFDEGFDDFDGHNSLAISLSEILSVRRKKFTFRYEYDFGDSWIHQIEYEGTVTPGRGKKFPVCTAGSGACPIEDSGGVYGYCDMLDAIDDPDHDRHDDLSEWLEDFDPKAFDKNAATEAMRSVE